LAVAWKDNPIKVWDTTGGQALVTLQGHAGPVHRVVFSPDGKRVAGSVGGAVPDVIDPVIRLPGDPLLSKSPISQVWVWDATTGEKVFTLRAKWCPQAYESIAFSADGKQLAGATNYGFLVVWDAQSGEELDINDVHDVRLDSDLRGGLPKTSLDFIGMVFSADGRRLASVSRDHKVTVYDTHTGKRLHTINTQHANFGIIVAFSPDGQRLAGVTGDILLSRWEKTVKVWDMHTGRVDLTLDGHMEPVVGVGFSPDGQRLATASLDKTLKLWDAKTGQEILTLSHPGATWVAFSADGKRLVSLGLREDRTVKVWDAGP
jgi:WD40 repeat protein